MRRRWSFKLEERVQRCKGAKVQGVQRYIGIASAPVRSYIVVPVHLRTGIPLNLCTPAPQIKHS